MRYERDDAWEDEDDPPIARTTLILPSTRRAVSRRPSLRGERTPAARPGPAARGTAAPITPRGDARSPARLGPAGTARPDDPGRQALARVLARAANASRALASRPSSRPVPDSSLRARLWNAVSPRRWSVRQYGLLAGVVAIVLAAALSGIGSTGEGVAQLGAALWSSSGAAHVLPTPIGGYWDPPITLSVPPPPSYTDAAHYMRKYGFDQPAPGGSLWPGEPQRLADMLPFAIAATARWDARFQDQLEPQMLLFWTHAEGISGRVNYSNCANEAPPPGTSYFTDVKNCDTPNFWQLGYGIQFGVISILKTAFIDMRGDPNDARLVQHIGQAVLDWDRQHGTVPVCGGYACTFPAMTIDQLMAGVSLAHPTTNNWWASVLARDPAINCYILADALVWFNHEATRNWVGCYYAEPCWGEESNRLGDILTNWSALMKRAGL